MFFRKLHIILLATCSQLTILYAGATPALQATNDLKEIINRARSDQHYRSTLQLTVYPLLEEFYANNQYKLQWFGTTADIVKRNKLITLISEPEKYMLEPGAYNKPGLLHAKKIITRADSLYAELRFTDAALNFLKDIAYPSTAMVKYNGWNYKPDCIAIPSVLQQALQEMDFQKCIQDIEPENMQFRKLRSVYQQLYTLFTEKNFHELIIESKTISPNNKNLRGKLIQLGHLSKNDTTVVQLYAALKKFQSAHNLPIQDMISINCLKKLNQPIKAMLQELSWNVRWFRWLSCMQNKSYILVNIAANRLTFSECNEEVLTSKTVVGKITTPTPTQTSVIRNVIYYPYWNIPAGIATKEMLPKLKRDPYYLNKLKIEVLQGSHTYTSSAGINWRRYSAHYFPFNLRQQPGCNNSLGLLKFDFENPFNTYLHDTNNKDAFSSKIRFFSHGCIRIEKPYELALLLGIPSQQINMDSCLTGMKPQVIPLSRSIPIFIIYATIDVINGELCWFEDAYHKRKY